jgi:hypothetical protein
VKGQAHHPLTAFIELEQGVVVPSHNDRHEWTPINLLYGDVCFNKAAALNTYSPKENHDHSGLCLFVPFKPEQPPLMHLKFFLTPGNQPDCTKLTI